MKITLRSVVDTLIAGNQHCILVLLTVTKAKNMDLGKEVVNMCTQETVLVL